MSLLQKVGFSLGMIFSVFFDLFDEISMGFDAGFHNDGLEIEFISDDNIEGDAS